MHKLIKAIVERIDRGDRYVIDSITLHGRTNIVLFTLYNGDKATYRVATYKQGNDGEFYCLSDYIVE